ncbi:MAG: hypothetical protein ACOX2F_12680 [bacterium]
MKKTIAIMVAVLFLSCGSYEVWNPVLEDNEHDTCDTLGQHRCNGTQPEVCGIAHWRNSSKSTWNTTADGVTNLTDCAEYGDDYVCELTESILGIITAECKKNGSDNNENTENTIDNETPDNDDNNNDEACTLDKNWMTPDREWAEWSYLRMIGLVTTYNGNDYEAADFIEGNVKVGGITKDLRDGAFQNFQNNIIIADALSYDATNIDLASGTATIDMYDAMWQFSRELIPVLKEEKKNEKDFAAFVWFRHSFIDVDVDFGTGFITEQRMRKNCWVGLAATEERKEFGEIYDIPVGGIFGCFDNNVNGSVGETLKMMFRNKMTGDRNDILSFINTQEDESVLEYGDKGFQFECQCYPEVGLNEYDGNAISCWEYDGPGGPECPLEAEEDGLCGGD